MKDPILDVSFASSGAWDMPTFVRMFLAVLLLLVAAFCVYQAIAAGEFPESRGTYWLIDGMIGLASLSGVCWLLWPNRSYVHKANR
jgi:hypothetical protein